ncbi:amidoligase family protein [Telluribacter sp. SYSU D00476]|uniref:amidoligase family protein n=1 Tax=Telluribacter sp. SYSU D00476 TaxID=2811430 RepID=UPI001FF51604|nr:amidoligase family protein [Telluribacter sp. SYSU D00476]
MQFKQPPLLYNERGETRTAGFELEFSNVGIEEAVQIIRELYGGEIEIEGRFRHKVLNTSIGDFTVEFDSVLLTEKRYKTIFDTLNIHPEEVNLGTYTLEEGVETVLEGIVGKLLPYEIACPPVPFTELDKVEKLRIELYKHRAEGTQAFPTNAFGTHINVEVPDTKPETLLNYIRAVILLHPWLLEAGQTDLARKISPFIVPYPAKYAELILAPGYEPDLDELINDYHRYNPDRNRPLDMYPVFAHINPDLLNQFDDLGKVKPRRTFHYRLPNSSISLPDWSLAQEWNLWVLIEEVATDTQRLAEMSQEYRYLKEHTLIGFDGKWIKRTEQWLS